MSSGIRKARPDDIGVVLSLLEQARLPAEGVSESFGGFLVAEDDDGILGTVGLEVYGGVGLLRSLAVRSGDRSHGVGTRLVEAILERCRHERLEAVYLLTTTAERFFPRFGFEPIPREDLDPRLSPSKELQGICPVSAVCMRLRLGPHQDLT